MPAVYILGARLTHWTIWKFPTDDSFVQLMLRKTNLGNFFTYYLKKVIWQTWKKKSWISLYLCVSVVYILKDRSKSLNRQLLPLDWEMIREMKGFQEEKSETKENEADMPQSKDKLRSLNPALGDWVVT